MYIIKNANEMTWSLSPPDLFQANHIRERILFCDSSLLQFGKNKIKL